mgnify:CR=1 FL=1
MKRVLVTGARGFLGHASMRVLKARGWDIVGVSSSDERGYTRVDLLDDRAIRAVLSEVRPTHLLHAAWKPVRGDVMRSPENLIWLRAGLGLVQAFRELGGERAVVIGSSAEYDWNHGICRNHVTPLRPGTIYGACKNAMRIALESYASTIGLSFIWPRVFFVYGPGEHETRLGASVIRSLLRGEPAECTEGLQVRDYLHVDDVASGIVAALESDYNGTVDIASGDGVAVRDLVLTIARELDREDLVRLGARPLAPSEAPLVVGDPAEAASVLGWTARFTLKEGITDTVARERATFVK